MKVGCYLTVAPNGINASFAILKHCIPNGMPMMVQHSNIPFTAAHIASGMPLMIIQIIFAINDGAPPPYCTSLPNGANAKDANLKHCTPMGIPIIVAHHKSPIKNHANACQIPPQIIHIILPIHPIIQTPRSLRSLLESLKHNPCFP